MATTEKKNIVPEVEEIKEIVTTDDKRKLPPVDPNKIDPVTHFIPNQPILGTSHVFFPYFFAFLYSLLLIIVAVGIFMIPLIKNDAYATIERWIDMEAFASLAPKFEGLVSVFDITKNAINPLLTGAEMGIAQYEQLASLYCVVLFAIFLVIELIWFVIKFVISFIGMITCGIRKHAIIDNFFFKNTHQYFNIGVLDYDFAFIVTLLINVIIFAGINANVILGMIGQTMPIALFDSIANTDLFNFGTIAFLVLLGALVLFRIIYRLSVGLLSKKVSKTYIARAKDLKAKQ